MSTKNIDEYFAEIAALVANADVVQASSLTYDKRSSHVGFIRGDLYLVDGSILHVREFVHVGQEIERYMYVYHCQDSEGRMIFRYDNSPHYPQLEGFPHHKHVAEGDVVATPPPDLFRVLQEVRQRLVGRFKSTEDTET